ncbi:MAG: 50S ribosomal protein L30e [Aigarchaeota archaeon]|nr:50S ribosomal protein L30e [Aigarchaeota archaeon]MDW8092995.1 50S ribosomal protein L30e [Nitrososphaerota archaeon]
MDIRKELEVVRRTGKVIVGGRQVYLSALNRKAKLVILARNCPEDFRRRIKVIARINNIKIIDSEIEGREVGLALGKPFSTTAVAVIDPGSSSLVGEEGVE